MLKKVLWLDLVYHNWRQFGYGISSMVVKNFFINNNNFMITIFESLYLLKLFQILSARLSLYSQDTLIAFESVEFWPLLKKLHNLTRQQRTTNCNAIKHGFVWPIIMHYKLEKIIAGKKKCFYERGI